MNSSDDAGAVLKAILQNQKGFGSQNRCTALVVKNTSLKITRLQSTS